METRIQKLNSDLESMKSDNKDVSKEPYDGEVI